METSSLPDSLKQSENFFVRFIIFSWESSSVIYFFCRKLKRDFPFLGNLYFISYGTFGGSDVWIWLIRDAVEYEFVLSSKINRIFTVSIEYLAA